MDNASIIAYYQREIDERKKSIQLCQKEINHWTKEIQQYENKIQALEKPQSHEANGQ